jgi:heme/copper-type cytochrome/quinol oxidase subunit 1
LLVAATFFVYGFFLDTLDVAVHDTYFVVSGMHVGIAGALLYIGLWALYHYIPVFRTIKWLSAVHITGTSLSGVLIFLLMNTKVYAPKRYNDYSIYEDFNTSSEIMSINVWISIAACVFLLLQTCWLVQVLAWIAKRNNEKPRSDTHLLRGFK